MVSRRLELERHGTQAMTTHRRLAIIGLAASFLVVSAQLVVAARYNGRLIPGIQIGGVSVGGLTLPQARVLLERKTTQYHLRLDAGSNHYDLTAAQLGVSFDTEATLDSAYREGRSCWPFRCTIQNVPFAYSLDRTKLADLGEGIAAKIGVQPTDATLLVRGTELQTIPDKPGWTIDRQGLERLIEADVQSPGGTPIQVRPRQEAADVQAADVAPAVAQAKDLMATPLKLTYADKTFLPTASDIGSWLTFDKSLDGGRPHLVASIDSSKLKDYVQIIANEINVAPVSKKITIENGVTQVQQDGADGLAIDQDNVTAALSAAVLNRQPLDFAVTTHPVPFKTIATSFITLDYGRYIEINLSQQHMWVWQDHNVIYDSPITSGATGAGFPTVTGLFSIYYKTTNTHLVGYQYGPRYNYDVAVQYWMPFYGGFGLHDASWRHGNFGGQDYYYGGSHGCVNLPDATAAFVYNWATVGTPVWVHG